MLSVEKDKNVTFLRIHWHGLYSLWESLDITACNEGWFVNYKEFEGIWIGLAVVKSRLRPKISFEQLKKPKESHITLNVGLGKVWTWHIPIKKYSLTAT
jgi:hypothetical protein